MFKQLKEIAKIQSGSTIRGNYDDLPNGDKKIVLPRHIKSDGNIDYTSVKAISFDLRNPAYLTKGQLLFSSKGSFKVSLYDGKSNEYIASSAFFVISIDKNILLPAYLKEFLSSDYMRRKYRSMTDGATIPSISLKQFGEIIIHIPSLEEQSEIAKILALHEKYEGLLTRKIDLIHKRKNEVFKKLIKTGDIK